MTPWTVAHQAPLSMGFPRQEYRRGLSFHPPRDFSDPGIEPEPLAFQMVSCIAGRFFTICANWKLLVIPNAMLHAMTLSRSVVSDSCDLIDCSPPGSSVHGILQARILEWVAISFPRGSSQPRNQTRVSCTNFTN